METSGSTTGTANGGEKLRLEVVAGNAAGTVIEVDDELVIGRQAAGAGGLADDIEISRQHARISSDGEGGYLIEDLGSTNGTYVNGRHVEAPTALEIGDRIELGASALVVQSSATPPSESQAAEAIAPPSPEPEPAGGAQARVSIRIELDLDAGEATIALDDGSPELRLVHDDGSWRLS